MANDSNSWSLWKSLGAWGVPEPSGANQMVGTIFGDITDYLNHPKIDLAILVFWSTWQKRWGHFPTSFI
jgi:hypothetical protein